MELRFTQAARRHRIGEAHVVYVVASVRPTPSSTAKGNPALKWVGSDSTGRELEIVGVALEASTDPMDPAAVLIIHVMPTSLRGAK